MQNHKDIFFFWCNKDNCISMVNLHRCGFLFFILFILSNMVYLYRTIISPPHKDNYIWDEENHDSCGKGLGPSGKGLGLLKYLVNSSIPDSCVSKNFGS
jgi:hypothetical protein